MITVAPQTELSIDASRLLNYLRNYCTDPSRSKTHRSIAEALSIPDRSVIDLADELLQAGHVVIARVRPPMGIWLLDPSSPTDHGREAYEYHTALRRRAGSIYVRARHVRLALARLEAQRHRETSGQLTLFN